MKIGQIFFGPDNLLRSGWRAAIFIVGLIVTGAIVLLLAAAIFPSTVGEAERRTPAVLAVGALAILVPALLVGWLCGKYLEDLPLRALGASAYGPWLRNLLLGLLIGAGTLGLAVAIAFITGGVSFSVNEADRNSILQTLAISFGVFAVAAAAEEALFRGYILQTFIRSDLTVFAILGTSLFFAISHQGNPSANLLGWVNTFIAGIWFGVAYLKTRDLWFVTGLHLIWNWMQGAVFGIEVSGLTELVKEPLLRETETGPPWLTGGEYGLEGGVVTTIAIIVSIAAIYFLPIRPREIAE